MKRDLQLSLVEGLERPTGPLPPSIIAGNNDDLIARIAPLYLNGRVLDCTYGRGMWWRKFRPADFTTHDLALDGIDFRDLPEPANHFDAVCFDPPYVPSGGNGPSAKEYRDRYGLTARTRLQMDRLIDDGIRECARVLKPSGFLLAKCCDYVSGNALHLRHVNLIEAASEAGLRVEDFIIHHSGPGPGGTNIVEVRRTRRHHSYLIVFRPRRRRSKAATA